MKRILIYFLVAVMTIMPVSATAVKSVGNIQHDYSIMDVPEKIVFTTKQAVEIENVVSIPENSVINAEFCQSQKERRWHRSGFIICKLISYVPEENAEPVDVSDKDLYFVIRKHEPIKGKDAAILTTEIILTQAAGIVGSCFIYFAPVDIAYFFTKGAIQREKHPNWFKAGVSNAYDNSICWFWLKGKNIELQEGSDIKMKSMKKEKAQKLTQKITKAKEKESVKLQKKAEKRAIKDEKAYAREMKRFDRYEAKCNKKTLRQEKKIQKLKEKEQRKQEKILAKEALKQD